MPTPLSSSRLLLLPFVVSSALTAQGLLRQHGEQVLTSGMPMPGSHGASPNDFPAGAVMATASNQGVTVQPLINGDGIELFRARARDDAALGIDNTNATALFLGRGNGDLRMVVRQGDPAPGLAATTRLQTTTGQSLPLLRLRLAPFADTLVFISGLADPVTPANTPTTADSAMFWGRPGSLQLLLREGDGVAALPLARYGEVDSGLANLILNAAGTVVCRNRLQTGFGGVTTANDGTVLVGVPGNLQILLREGVAWNGVGAAGEVVARVGTSEFPTTSVQIDEAGRVLHDLQFVVPSGSATSTANDRALALWTAGSDAIVAREGDQAPGMPTGAVFADGAGFAAFFTLSPNSLTRDGSVAFLANFPAGPGGVTAADDRALFLHAGGTTSLLVREGNPAPAALGAGVTWGAIEGSLTRNDAGQFVIATTLGGAVTPADDSAVLVGTPNAFTVIAREGGAAPGMPGFLFAQIAPPALTITARGQVLFGQQVTNGTTTLAAWFLWTPEHGLRLWFDPTETWTTPLGTSTLPVVLGINVVASGDTPSAALSGDGDFAGLMFFQGTDGALLGQAQVRGHVGAFLASPPSVPASGGTQSWQLDCGPAQAGRIYFVLTSSLGTRPGFVTPLGPQTIPLNLDPLWTTLSIQAANSPTWVASVGFTDAQGRSGPAAFVMPSGLSGFAGTELHHAAVLFDLSLASTFVTEPVGLLLR